MIERTSAIKYGKNTEKKWGSVNDDNDIDDDDDKDDDDKDDDD